MMDGAAQLPRKLTRPIRRVDIVLMASPARLLPGPFTVELYHKLGELGIFDEDDRVELLDGQVVVMTPIGRRHAQGVQQLGTLLARRTTGAVTVSTQNPLRLNRQWEPQPDVAVLRRAAGLPEPADVLLIVEVADSSLERDRDVKIPAYARHGVPETWLVDLTTSTITVYSLPSANGYRDAMTVQRGETLRSSQLAGLEITVDEILG
jgi:Uma2 family endonuclease